MPVAVAPTVLTKRGVEAPLMKMCQPPPPVRACPTSLTILERKDTDEEWCAKLCANAQKMNTLFGAWHKGLGTKEKEVWSKRDWVNFD